MTPRPRLASDQQIVMATAHVIGRVGPGDLTLADVAHELNISPATLVQRFGSKRGLLLSVAEFCTAGVEDCFARARSRQASPLAALLASFDECTSYVTSPEALAHQLAFLQMDLTDSDFHRFALGNARKVEAGIAALLEEAVAAGELLRCDTKRLARTFNAVYGGSMVAWAIFRQGKLQPWVRRDLETLLEPLRIKVKGKRKREKVKVR